MFAREPIDEQGTMATFHWGKWVFSNEPTTGVISVNSLEWIHDEVDYHAVVNLSYDSYLEQNLNDRMREWQQDNDTDDDPDDDLLEQWRDELGEQYEEQCDTYLIGSWRFDDASQQWEIDKNPNLKDEDAYAAIVDYDFSGGIVQVVWSRFVSRATLCSPCCPGQCDMDSEGGYIGYDLPLSFYGDRRENTYPQLRCEEITDINGDIVYELSPIEVEL